MQVIGLFAVAALAPAINYFPAMNVGPWTLAITIPVSGLVAVLGMKLLLFRA